MATAKTMTHNHKPFSTADQDLQARPKRRIEYRAPVPVLGTHPWVDLLQRVKATPKRVMAAEASPTIRGKKTGLTEDEKVSTAPKPP
jgi:hypothetical protein